MLGSPFAGFWPVAAVAHIAMVATVAVNVNFRFILAAVIGRAGFLRVKLIKCLARIKSITVHRQAGGFSVGVF